MPTANPALIDLLMPTFRAELSSRTAALNRGFEQLETRPASAGAGQLVRDLAREAHSLKGAARSVQERRIERVCERLESELGGKAGLRAVSEAEAIAALRSALPELEHAVSRLAPAGEVRA